jgi:hypothetical protein
MDDEEASAFFKSMHGGFAAAPVSVRREADAHADCAHETTCKCRPFESG